MISQFIDVALDYSFAGWLIALKLAVAVLFAISALELVKAAFRACFRRKKTRAHRRKHQRRRR